MKLYVLNGPNLNLLGVRKPDQYGTETFAHLTERIAAHAAARGIEVIQRQSNHEGDLVDWIQEAYFARADGLVINPGAYTHTSIALLDALKATRLRAVEVHISDPEKREPYRHISYTGMACRKVIKGKGLAGYREAILYLKELAEK